MLSFPSNYEQRLLQTPSVLNIELRYQRNHVSIRAARIAETVAFRELCRSSITTYAARGISSDWTFSSAECNQRLCWRIIGYSEGLLVTASSKMLGSAQQEQNSTGFRLVHTVDTGPFLCISIFISGFSGVLNRRTIRT